MRGRWAKAFSVEYLGLDEQAVSNDWTDIPSYAQSTGYPTENSAELLARVIETSSNPQDIVLACFIGSGTTAAEAQKLGRRWIGCDINKGAIQTTPAALAGRPLLRTPTCAGQPLCAWCTTALAAQTPPWLSMPWPRVATP